MTNINVYFSNYFCCNLNTPLIHPIKLIFVKCTDILSNLGTDKTNLKNY